MLLMHLPDKDEMITRLAQRRTQYVGWASRRVGSLEDAEDIVQQAMLRASQRLEQLDTPEALEGWFWQILRTTLANSLAKRDAQRRKQQRILQYEKAAPGYTLSPPSISESICDCGVQEFEKLPESLQEVMLRVDLYEQSCAEVADELELSVNATRVRAHRARRAMRERLQERCGVNTAQECMQCDC